MSNHVPSRLDVITDLRRCIYASYGKDGFNDSNFLTFFNRASENLKKIRLASGVGELVDERLRKFQDTSNPADKRREELLTISSLI